jgi:hypothetical protein
MLANAPVEDLLIFSLEQVETTEVTWSGNTFSTHCG